MRNALSLFSFGTVCALTLFSSAALAQELTITNARIIDGTGNVIERGADVNVINPQTGQSVLDIFERFKNTEAIAVLRAAGARNAIGPKGARNR